MAFVFFLLLSGFAWMGLRGDLGPAAFVTGAIFGVVAWRLEHVYSSEPFDPRRALLLAWRGAKVAASFAAELVVANWQQLRVVLAPRVDVQPHWIHFDTRIESPALRLVLGIMVSLTPGTLVCDEIEGADGSVCLWIHILDGEDPEAVLDRIRRRLETPLHALEKT